MNYKRVDFLVPLAPKSKKEAMYSVPTVREKPIRTAMFFFVIFMPKNAAEIYTPNRRVEALWKKPKNSVSINYSLNISAKYASLKGFAKPRAMGIRCPDKVVISLLLK